MADFTKLQQKFDSDPDLCKRFLSDPVGVLAENDITLSPQQAFRLQQEVADFTRPIEASPDIKVHVSAPKIGIGPGIGVHVGGGIDVRR
jgi:hypothetical protein